MARRYRPRKLFKFWLYHDLDEDIRLMEYIQFLVKTRQFATTVRNGLRLMWTLGQGDFSVLFELFPTLRSQFTPDNTALIEEFRRLLKAQSNVAPGLLPMTGPQPLTAAKQLPMPVADGDDQDTIILKRSTSTDASVNLFNAMLGLQQ